MSIRLIRLSYKRSCKPHGTASTHNWAALKEAGECGLPAHHKNASRRQRHLVVRDCGKAPSRAKSVLTLETMKLARTMGKVVLKDKLTKPKPNGTRKRHAKAYRRHSHCFQRPAATVAVHYEERTATKSS